MKASTAKLLSLIKEKGSLNGEVVKVDMFLNHLVDTELIKLIGRDIAEHFKNENITKIITAESSGIVVAQAAAFYMDIPYIYAKKQKPRTMQGFYQASSYSFTKQCENNFYVSKDAVEAGERLLFADDFYAKGNTSKAVREIVETAGAEFAGCCVVIDKSENKDIFSVATLSEIKDFLQ